MDNGLERARQALADGMPQDAVAQDLQSARRALHGVYEHSDHQAVIDRIFSRFCVGK